MGNEESGFAEADAAISPVTPPPDVGPHSDVVERLLDFKHRWGNHQDRKDGAAEILHLRAQVARDNEHYEVVRAMSEKHRKLWVEASQERDRLRAEAASDKEEAAKVTDLIAGTYGIEGCDGRIRAALLGASKNIRAAKATAPVDAVEEQGSRLRETPPSSPSLERVAVLEGDNKRLRDLVYRLSDTLTDEGADWSNEGVANLRDRCARALPDVEWLQPYLKDQSDA